MKTVIACLVAVALCGCSVLSPKIAPQLAKAAKKYCEQPEDARHVLRNQVNAAIAPAQAKVWCLGDSDAPPFPDQN